MSESTRPFRPWKAAPHVIIMACAFAAYLSTECCTWSYGGAIWRYWRASWHSERAAEERPRDQALSEEDLSRMLEEARRWDFWRDVSGWTAMALAFVSLLCLILRPSKLSVASFIFCLVMVVLSDASWSILF
jgi:hypothetical protein